MFFRTPLPHLLLLLGVLAVSLGVGGSQALADDAPAFGGALVEPLNAPPAPERDPLAEAPEERGGSRWIADDLKLELDPTLDPAATEGEAPKGGGEEEEYQRKVVRNGAYLLYWYEYDPNDASTFMHILGLYWQRDRPDWRLDLMLPIGAYWQWKDEPDRWGLATPLAWHVSDDGWDYTGAWLYHRYRSATTSFDGLLPLMWHYGDRVEGDDLYVVGTGYWRTRGEHGRAFGLLPLFWGSKDEESASWTLLPLAHYSAEPGKSLLLTPLFFDREDGARYSGGIPALLTFWGVDKEQGDQWSFQLPLFYSERNPARGEGSGGILPLLTFWSYDEDEATVGQFPLFLRHTDHNSTLQFITPLMFGYHKESGWREVDAAGLLPFYLSYEDPDHDFKLLAPLLYARLNTPDTDFAMLGPLFSHERGGVSTWGAAPLFGVQNDANTDTHRGGVLPLLAFWEFSPELASFGQLPLFWRRVDEDSTLQFITPLMFGYHEENPRGVTDIAGLLPVYLSYEDDDTEFKLLAPLLYSRWNDEETDFAMLGPLFSHARGGVSTWGVAPLFGVRHDSNEDRKQLLALPGVYWSDGPDHLTLVAGPLWTAHNDDGMRSDAVLPLFLRHRSEDGSRALWLPGLLDIASRESPEELNWRFTWLLNGVRYEDRHEGQVTTAVAPLFIESHNTRSGDSWALTLPWIYTSGNSLRDERTIFALPFFYDRAEGATDWAVYPLVFSHESEDAEALTVLPFWHDRREGDRRLQLGPLVYGRYREGDDVDMGWAGLYGWHEDEDSSLRLLAPVWMDWEERTADGIKRSLDVVAPLYARYEETGADGVTETTTAVGPLFGYEGRDGSGFGLFPLVWHDRLRRPEGDRGHDILFPLAWRFFDEAEGRDTTIVGPLYALERPNREDYGAFPLYAGGWSRTDAGHEEGYQTVLPLFWYDYGVDPYSNAEEALLLTPVGYTSWYGEEVSGLWGNYYFDRTATSMTDLFFPLVYRHRDEQGHTVGVAPLYWDEESPEGSLRIVAPFYAHGEDRIEESAWTWAFPYLGWEDERDEVDMVLPLYLSARDRVTGNRVRTLLPLWLDIEDKVEGTRFQGLGPVWHRENGRGGYDTGVFPLVWWGEETRGDEGEGYAVGFPVFWRFVDGPEEALTVVPPGWYRSWEQDAWSAGLFPVGFAQRDPANALSRTMIGPIYHSDVEGEQTFVAAPLYMHHLEPEQGRRLHLGPLYGHGADEQAGTSWTWVGPVFTSEEPGGSATTVVPVYASRENPDGSSWRFALPYYGSRGADGSRLDTVAGLVWDWEGAPAPDTGEPTSGGTVVGPIYRTWDEEETTTGLAPIAHVENREDGSTTGWVLPVAYYDRSADGSEKTLIAGPMFMHEDRERLDWGVAPVVWGYREPTRRGHAVLPLYWYEGRDTGHTFISPLAASRREGDEYANWALLYGSWGDGQVSHRVAFPLLYSRRGQDGSALDLVAPLFARYRSAGARSGATVLFPLYWDFYNADKQTQFKLVAPFYAHSEDAEEELTILPLWFMKRRKDGTRMSHGLIPLYYYSEDPLGYQFNVLGGLVGVDHNEKKGETDMQLMWIPF